jgi:uncharacterized protein (TIGR04255 family)
MSTTTSLTIDLTESFPLLARAPIVEAVVELRARAQAEWKESSLREQLAARLPEYPELAAQREMHFEATISSEGSYEQLRRDAWRGVRATSADKLHIGQFNRDGFAFSRLEPYQDWDQFLGEALRLWQIHADLAKPTEVQRLGVRFINRIAMPVEGKKLRDVLTSPPQCPQNMELPVLNYLHQDTFGVPGYPYAIKRTQTIQPTESPGVEGPRLILDIDVFTTQAFEPTMDVLKQRLAEMRWLKDKMFFGSITPDALQSFQKG